MEHNTLMCVCRTCVYNIIIIPVCTCLLKLLSNEVHLFTCVCVCMCVCACMNIIFIHVAIILCWLTHQTTKLNYTQAITLFVVRYCGLL